MNINLNNMDIEDHKNTKRKHKHKSRSSDSRSEEEDDGSEGNDDEEDSESGGGVGSASSAEEPTVNAEDFKNSVEDLNEKDYEQGGKYHDKRFFRSSRFLFTYKTRIPKDQLQQFFKDKSKNHPIKYCWIAHEAHPDQVTHAVVIWETLLNYTSCRYFDYETIHPHVQQIKPGNENLGRVLLYVSKEDEENRPFKKVAAEFLWGKARKSRNGRN